MPARVPLFALFTGNAISMVGSILSYIAVPWFVLQITGSPSKTGITAFFAALPAILSGIFGGSIVDRLGYKRASVIADIASGITIALIPLLFHFKLLEFWQLLVLLFLGKLLGTPGYTARTSLVPDLASRAAMPLERANAFNGAIENASLVVGAPLAGILIAVMGTSNVLWLDAVSFAISALMVISLVPSPPAKAEKPTEGTSSGYLEELKEGLRFIRRDKLILPLLIAVMITSLLDSPLFDVVLPVYARHVFGSSVNFGVMVAAFGVGALAGTIAYGIIGHKLSRRATFIGAFIMVGLPFWALATLPPLSITVAALLISGLASGPINPIGLTVLQERVPENMRGRVFGLVFAGISATPPLGALLDGYALEWIGLPITLAIIAAAYLATTLSMLFNPGIREMDRRTENVQEQGEIGTQLQSSQAEGH